MQIVELSWSKNTSSIFSLTENDRSLLGLKMQLYCLKGFFLFLYFILCPKIHLENSKLRVDCINKHSSNEIEENIIIN